MNYTQLSKIELEELLAQELQKLENFKAMKLNLNMARGKPASKQLDLSMPIFDVLDSTSNLNASTDMRNYGGLEGIDELREFFAKLCEVNKDEIIVSDSASLNIMYDNLQRAMQFGVCGEKPFKDQGKIKWLCPCPGYDRHFAITELFGIEMINIPMQEDGPDMEMVKELVENDSSVKGIWCVPKYSNPDGFIYSDEVVKAFANLKPAAKDFRIYWDNAYMIHHLYEEDTPLLNLLNEAKKAGNEDIVYIFGSTSKITFAGAGVSFFIASKNNLNSILKLMSIQTIGPNKVNQYMHYLYFTQKEKIEDLMKKHSALITPKFELVNKILEEELGDKGIIEWFKPKGGYFISCYLLEGTASKAVKLSKECGVIFTPAGATYPYGKDPKDSNIRIAPTLPPLAELETAMKVFAVAVKVAALEKLIKG